MDYQGQFKKFITSQYLYAGMRITAAFIIPAIILYQNGLLETMMAVPLGALFVSLTDNAGPLQYRRNGMLVSILINFIVVVITGFSRSIPWLIGIEIILFGFIFSSIGIFGARSNAIGSIALIVFILNTDARGMHPDVWMQGLLLTIGGVWYFILSMVFHRLRPYKLIQQLLGECLMETSLYLKEKAKYYEQGEAFDSFNPTLLHLQVTIQNQHAELREMLFATRQFTSETTNKGRILMMMFLDTVDLFERIMTAQQNYKELHSNFDDTKILQQVHDNIVALAERLHNIGLAVQGGYAYNSGVDLDEFFNASLKQFIALRDKKMNAANIEQYITLRHILYSVQDITERVRRLQAYSTYDQKHSRNYNDEHHEKHLISHESVNFQLIISNLDLSSAHFRHSIRLVTALIIGYVISLLFPLGHGYWILLTITTIIKPAYSITRKRNFQRLIGTFIGALVGFGILYFTINTTVLFILLVLSMVIAYSLLRLQYLVSTMMITIYVLISFHFMSPTGLSTALGDRIIDTTIGSLLAFLVSYFVLPTWEHEQISSLAAKALEANRKYFSTVSSAFTSNPVDAQTLASSRKEAFVALANISDNFQRMLSEPKGQQLNVQHFHQFVSSTHMLTSHIASLSYYAQRFGNKYAAEDFEPMVKQVRLQFKKAIQLLTEETTEAFQLTTKFPIHQRVQQLLELRKNDLNTGVQSDMEKVRRQLSDLKSVTDQFQLIHGVIVDELKIISRIKQIRLMAS
jgi:uncharacterized membrane protein (TIGR01666 family)